MNEILVLLTLQSSVEDVREVMNQERDRRRLFSVVRVQRLFVLASLLISGSVWAQTQDAPAKKQPPMFIVTNASGPAGGEVRYIVALPEPARTR